jgi:DNA-binding NarL/FixJ family response regulator
MLMGKPLLSDAERTALLDPVVSHASANAPIRLLVADPHPIVLEGFKQSMGNHPDFEIVRYLVDGANTWRELLASRPDVLIMEMTLTGMSSMQLIRNLYESGWPTKIVLFSLPANQLWIEALAQGVQGLVSKNKSNDQLMNCVRRVHQGELWLDEEFNLKEHQKSAQRISDWRIGSRLTMREKAIVEILMRGFSNREIANELAIKEGTVKTHLKHVYRKTGLHSRFELLSQVKPTL